MPKVATLKDVLYALEYGHEELVYASGAKGSPWTLSQSGTKVDRHVADAARSHVEVVALAAPHGTARYGWRVAA